MVQKWLIVELEPDLDPEPEKLSEHVASDLPIRMRMSA